MPSIKNIVLAYLGLFLIGARADGSDIETVIDFWADSSCGEDLMSGDNRVTSFRIRKDQVITEDDDNGCRGQILSLPGWPTDSSTGQYIVHVDKSGIQDDCKLMLFSKERDDDDVGNQCKQAYVTINSVGECARVTMGTDFGWGYCCGDGCTQTTSGAILNPGGRKTRRQDIAATKRAPVSSMFDKRAECKFDKSEEYQTYGPQERITNVASCGAADGCTVDVQFATSLTYSDSWGISGSASATVGYDFIVTVEASLEVGMSYTETQMQEQSMSWRTTATIPEGSGGYLAFEPRLVCAKGKFTGDCAEWPAKDDGEACFVRQIGGHPDGVISFVRMVR